MRIVMLTTSFPLCAGHTSGVFIHDLASQLVERGHTVTVLAPHAPGAARTESLDGVAVRRFRYALPTSWERLAYGAGIPATLRNYPWRKLLLPQFSLSYIMAALQECRDCDLIHAHWTFSGLIGTVPQWLYRKPVIITVHGSDINNLPKAGMSVWLTRWVLKRAASIICVSADLASSVQRLGIISEKLQVIYNGVNIDAFQPKENRPGGHHIVWVGRLSSEKGLSVLLKAMRTVLTQLPDATLTIIGDGEDRDMLSQEVKELGIGGAVDFLGPKPHDELPELLQQKDLFVLPSFREGLGIALIEAMAAGLPVVASSAGGIPEIVDDGRTGLLVPPGDNTALAEGMIRILHDEELSRRFSAAGRARVLSRFSAEEQVSRTIDVYERNAIRPVERYPHLL